MDSGRLATRQLVVVARTRAAWRSYQPNPLSALSRWKLMDNLRRSLVPVALTLLLLLGWMALPDAWFWTWLSSVAGYSCCDNRHFGFAEQAAEVRCGSKLLPPYARLGGNFGQVAIHTGLPSVRGLFQSRRDHADPRAAIYHSPRAS